MQSQIILISMERIIYSVLQLHLIQKIRKNIVHILNYHLFLWSKNYAYCKAEGFESDDLAALVYLTNDHAHNTIRVNAVLSSNDLFYDVYDVIEKDGMYVPPEKRVSIW